MQPQLSYVQLNIQKLFVWRKTGNLDFKLQNITAGFFCSRGFSVKVDRNCMLR